MTEPSASSNAPFLPGEQPPAHEPVGEVAAPMPTSGEHGVADPADLPPADPAAVVGADADAAPMWHSAPEPMLQPEPLTQPVAAVEAEVSPLLPTGAPVDSEVGPQPAPVDASPAADPVNAAAPTGAGGQASDEPPATPAELLPEPTPAPPAPTPEPAVAATVHVPAAPDTAEGGGEWDLLLAKLREWIGSGRLQQMLVQYQGPLRAVALALALVLVLRLYGAVIGAIDSLPLLPGLLELAGVIWLSRFAATRLVRSSDRQELIASLEQRWRAFRGND